MKSVWKDLRYGARMLTRTPVVTLVAALSLAIGISANTSTFSVVNGFMLEPLRWQDAERLVIINEFDLDTPSADRSDCRSSTRLRVSSICWAGRRF